MFLTLVLDGSEWLVSINSIYFLVLVAQLVLSWLRL